MNADQIANTLVANLAMMPPIINAPMIAFTFNVRRVTAQKALERLAAAGILKVNGRNFTK